jgi:hypothetical protein
MVDRELGVRIIHLIDRRGKGMSSAGARDAGCRKLQYMGPGATRQGAGFAPSDSESS